MEARLAPDRASTNEEGHDGRELEQELRDFFGALDHIELEPLVERITDDMQGIEKISRGSTRGKSEFEAGAMGSAT